MSTCSVEPGDQPGQLHDRVSLRRDLDPGLTRPERRWVDGKSYANVDMQPDLRPLADDVHAWLQAMETQKRKVDWPFDPGCELPGDDDEQNAADLEALQQELQRAAEQAEAGEQPQQPTEAELAELRESATLA